MADDLEERIFAKVKGRTPAAKDLVIQSVQLVTLVVCGLWVYATLAESPINLPEFLTSVFLPILGFYFGKSVERSRED